MNKEHFLSNLWLWKCDKMENKVKDFNYNDLSITEWSSEFEQYMRNRLIMGAVRYGKLVKGSRPKYDRVSEVSKRLEMYKKTGNQEYLVDIANFCMCEYIEPSIDNVYFKAIDDGEHAGEI